MAGLLPMRGYLTRTFSRSWTFSSSSRFWRRAFWTVRSDLLERQGLLEEIEGPELGRLDGGLDRPVARDHHDLGILLAGLDPLQDLEAAHLGEPDVQEDEVEVLALQRLEPCLAGFRGLDREALVLEDPLEGGPDARFVVDDQYLFVAHVCPVQAGIWMVNFAPWGLAFSMSTDPSWSRMIWLTMARPRPMPFLLRGIVGEEELELVVGRDPRARVGDLDVDAPRRPRRRRSGSWIFPFLFMASMALSRMLMIARFICSGSAWTGAGTSGA